MRRRKSIASNRYQGRRLNSPNDLVYRSDGTLFFTDPPFGLPGRVLPRLADIFRSPIDTLWLNPLAFPRNPYHHLVKHYHDGRLQAGHVNDPEMDARLVFQVLRNQLAALKQQNADQPMPWQPFISLPREWKTQAGSTQYSRRFGELLRPVLLRREKRFTG